MTANPIEETYGLSASEIHELGIFCRVLGTPGTWVVIREHLLKQGSSIAATAGDRIKKARFALMGADYNNDPPMDLQRLARNVAALEQVISWIGDINGNDDEPTKKVCNPDYIPSGDVIQKLRVARDLTLAEQAQARSTARVPQT